MNSENQLNELAHQQSTNGGLRELALFAGAGGGILGGHLLGWRTVCAVEWTPYAAGVLIARQNDGILPPFPIWDDVQTFDGNPWRGLVDVVSGGFPCQDISAAGKGAGIDGARSGMWAHMSRIIGEVRPRYVFVENSPMLTSRGLGRVLGDLASMGYDAKWGVLGADDVGAPHRRKRIWIVANAHGVRKLQSKGFECDQRGRTGNGGPHVANTGHLRGRDWPESGEKESAEAARCSQVGVSDCAGSQGHDDNRQSSQWIQSELAQSNWWATEPYVGRVANGLAARVDRLKCLGNGQVPACAALAWKTLI